MEAAARLKEVIEEHQGPCGTLEFEELSGELEGLSDFQFLQKINAAIDARRHTVTDESTWNRLKKVAECIFTATSPFAKNFLAIANESQSVSSLIRAI